MGSESSLLEEEDHVLDSSIENAKENRSSYTDSNDKSIKLKEIEDKVRIRVQKDLKMERRVSDIQGNMMRMNN